MVTVSLLLVLCALLLLALYKVRKIHLATYAIATQTTQVLQEVTTLYAQLQAYQDLKQLLQLNYPLPPLRGWAASPDFLLTIAKHALTAQPNTVVECSSGSSTVVLARCLQLNGSGHVYSLEHDPTYARKTRDELQQQGLSSWATVVDAPLENLTLASAWSGQWYAARALNALIDTVDMLVVDGPPKSTGLLARYPALPVLINRLTHGASVFLDDAYRPDERTILDLWLKQFHELNCVDLYCEKGCVKIAIAKSQVVPSVVQHDVCTMSD